MSEGEIVRWSSDGSKFGVQSGSNIQIYATVRFLITIFELGDIHKVATEHGSSLDNLTFISDS